MTERWLPVVGYEGVYEVSDLGRVRRVASGQGTRGAGTILKSHVQAHGYVAVALVVGGRQMTKRIHRLVLEAFIGPCPPGMEGCHSDGSRANNVIGNLRWDSRSGNEKDKRRHGTLRSRTCPDCGRVIVGPSFFRHRKCGCKHIRACRSKGLLEARTT